MLTKISKQMKAIKDSKDRPMMKYMRTSKLFKPTITMTFKAITKMNP